jgi:hypothetical protein
MDPSALPPLPGNASLPLGALGFEIRNVNLGEEVDVSIYFPAGIAADQYWKFTAGEWTDFTANTAFFSDHVVLHLVDGGAGDADGQANGVIVDPSGLVNPPPVALSDRYTTVKKAAISVGAPGVLGNDERVAGGAAVLDTGPAHGVLTLNVDGSFTYSPEGTFVGTDVFTYHVERTDGAFSEPGTVTLSVLSPGAQCDLSKYPSKKGVRNLKNANLAGCYLVGVDLSGADLGGAILTGANLQAANLAGANLAGANLTRAILVAANLTGAKLTRANLTDVVYGSTTCPDGSLSDNNGGTCAVI